MTSLIFHKINDQFFHILPLIKIIMYVLLSLIFKWSTYSPNLAILNIESKYKYIISLNTNDLQSMDALLYKYQQVSLV